ncbi:MAG: AGE family epimerase/isomerase [Paraglaciecola sp.]|uniref:AGE family epimerase/isomerase n=1 Tax=Paraglaciecola sp. TaxID=1920173 RepID=UPI003298AB96
MKPCQKFTRQAMVDELQLITDWWQSHSIDLKNGGFVGEVNSAGVPQHLASKGIILNSRILWFFSELAVFSGLQTEQGKSALATATRSYEYLMAHFDDKQYGGAVWELNHLGECVDSKKQTYAQCFCIYAFCAYYQATGKQQVLDKAMGYFSLVEQYTRDQKMGGYIEAFQHNWLPIEDFRLSEKDMNTPKSMNTHLHVLEAFSALYKVNPCAEVEESLRHVLLMFKQHIIDLENGHLRLFFSEDWRDQSSSYSYGHDIEASWLIWEAVEILADPELLKEWRPLVIHMAQVCAKESLGVHGQVCEDYDKIKQHKAQEGYWWVQAEALVGLLNLFHLTGDKHLNDICENIWLFIQRYHKDPVAGEWFWLANVDDANCHQSYKAGFWKAPYHNGRAMMEVIKLFDKLQQP